MEHSGRSVNGEDPRFGANRRIPSWRLDARPRPSLTDCCKSYEPAGLRTWGRERKLPFAFATASHPRRDSARASAPVTSFPDTAARQFRTLTGFPVTSDAPSCASTGSGANIPVGSARFKPHPHVAPMARLILRSWRRCRATPGRPATVGPDTLPRHTRVPGTGQDQDTAARRFGLPRPEDGTEQT